MKNRSIGYFRRIVTGIIVSGFTAAIVPTAVSASDKTVLRIKAGTATADFSSVDPTGSRETVSFSHAMNFGAGSGPYSVAIGDFNGDGKPDLAVANANSNTVSILLGVGTGSFSPAADFAVRTAPLFVAIGDLNGDVKLDLAVANANSNTVSILLGDGTGSFSPAADFAVGTFPVSVAIGDLNADGKS